jgi:hypothetical protein
MAWEVSKWSKFNLLSLHSHSVRAFVQDVCVLTAVNQIESFIFLFIESARYKICLFKV